MVILGESELNRMAMASCERDTSLEGLFHPIRPSVSAGHWGIRIRPLASRFLPGCAHTVRSPHTHGGLSALQMQ
jgi:hypothetical protein